MSSEQQLNSDYKKLDQARNRFITEVANNMYLYNITSSVGRLYGTVFFSEEPMTLDDMSKALAMSKTSMSTGIRALTEANMVERVWEKGIRKDLYKADDDWYKSFSNVFITRWRNATERNMEAIEDTKSELMKLEKTTQYDEIKKKVEVDLDKIGDAEAYYEWLNEVIALFETGEIFEIIPKKHAK